jgi:transcription elongation factor GreB
VTYIDDLAVQRTVKIIGIDEANPMKGEVSWVSPVARTLLKAREGDVLKLSMPDRVAEIEVLEVRYPAPQEVPGAVSK